MSETHFTYPFQLIAGNGQGISYSSQDQLGHLSVSSTFGRGQLQISIKSNGNLTLKDRQFEFQNLTEKLNLGFTYNSTAESGLSAWRFTPTQQLQMPAPDDATLIVTETDGHNTIYNYDPATKAYYAPGNGDGTPVISYDASIQAWQYIHPKTRHKEIFNDQGQVISSIDAAGNVTEFIYSENQLNTIKAAGAEFKIERDADQLCLYRQDKNAERELLHTYYFDAQQRLVESVPSSGNKISYSYQGNSFQIDRITQTDATEMGFTFDEGGRLQQLQIGGAESPTIHQFSYGENLFKFTDASGVEVVLTLDERGRLQSIIEEQGFLSKPMLGLDQTSIEYNFAGQVSKIHYPDQSAEVFEYAPLTGLLTKHTSRDGLVSEYTIEHGLLIAKTLKDPISKTELNTRFVYDTTFNEKYAILRFVISPSGRVTEIIRDANGLIQAERCYRQDYFTAAEASIADLLAWQKNTDLTKTQLTSYEYDASGRITCKREFSNVDVNGIGVIDSSTSETKFTNNALDQITEQKQLIAAIVANGGYVSRKDSLNINEYDGNGDLRFKQLAANTQIQQTTLLKYLDNQSRTLAPNLEVLKQFTNKQGLLQQEIENAESANEEITDYVRNSNNEVTQIVGSDRTFEILGYDKQHRLSYHISQLGFTIEKLFDRRFNCLIETRYGLTIDLATIYSNNKLDYAKLGVALNAITEKRTTYTFSDCEQRPRYIIDALNHLVEFRYDAFGNQLAKIEYRTEISTLELQSLLAGARNLNRNPDRRIDKIQNDFYDNDGLKIATQDPDGYITLTEYDAAKNQASKNVLNTPDLTFTTEFNQLKLQFDAKKDAKTLFLRDGKGQIRFEIDAEGYVVEHSYYPNGKNQRTIAYASKAEPNWLNNPVDLPSMPSNRNDHAIDYFYDELDRLIQTIGPFGKTTSYQYDNQNNLITTLVTDGTETKNSDNARGTEKQYDVLGRVIAEANPYVAEKLREVDQDLTLSDEAKKQAKQKIWDTLSLKCEYLNNLKIRETDSNGNVTCFYYDNDHRLIFSIDAGGEIAEYSYNGYAEKETETRYYRRYPSDSLASLRGGLITPDLTQEIHALLSEKDAKTIFERNPMGQIIKKIDPENNVYEYAYNSFKRCKLEKIPTLKGQPPLEVIHLYDMRGNETVTSKEHKATNLSVNITKEYANPLGKVTAITDENDRVTKYEYNRLGLTETVKKIRDDGSVLIVSQTTYDAFNRPTSEADALGATTSREYLDSLQQEIITHPDKTKTIIQNNIFGEKVSITNALGETDVFTQAPDGKIKSHTNPLNQTMSRGYDLTGRLISETDAKHTITLYQYKNRDLSAKICDINGLNLTEGYESNGLGQREKITNAKGVETKNTYDRNGNLTHSILDPNTEHHSGLDLLTRCTFTPQGQTHDTFVGRSGSLASLHTLKEHDALGRCIREVTDPDGLNISKATTFDNANKIIHEITPSGFLRAHYYDDLGRRCFTYEQITDKQGRVLNWQYDNLDHVTEERILSKFIPHAIITNETTISDLYKLEKSNEDFITNFYYDSCHRERFRIKHVFDSRNQKHQLIINEIRYDAAGREELKIEYLKTLDGNINHQLSTTDIEALILTIQDREHDRIQRKIHDKAGQEKYLIDPNGYIIEKEHDAAGNVIVLKRFKTPFLDTAALLTLNKTELMTKIASITSSRHHVEIKYFYYDAMNRRTHKINQKGQIVRTIYDGNNKETKKIRFKQRVGAQHDHAKMMAEALSRIETAEDSVTQFTHDAADRLETSTDPLHHKDHYYYDSVGNNTRYINRNKHIWEFKYDKAKRQTHKVAPEAPITSIQLDNGKLKATTTNICVVTKLDHDNDGNVTKLTKGDGLIEARSVNTVYDGFNKKSVTSIEGVPVDDQNIKADLSISPTTLQTVSSHIIRNSFGDVVAEKDENNNWNFYIYDSLRRCIFEIKNGSINENTYTTFDKVETKTRYANRIEIDAIKYSATGAQLSVSDIKIVRDPENDRTTRFKYDNLGNVIETKLDDIHFYSNETAGTAAPVVRNTYDYRGNCTTTSTLISPDVFATEMRWYDNLKNVIAELSPRAHLTVYHRDEAGRVQEKIEYANSLNTSVTTSDSLNELIAKVKPDNKDRMTRYRYNKLGKCTREEYINAEYVTVDLINGIPKVTKHVGALTKEYHYDPMQQLISTTYEDGSKAYNYWDARGYLCASTDVAFTPLGEPTIIPLTSYGTDVFGKTVQTVKHRYALTEIPKDATPVLARDADDREELKLFDVRGKLSYKQDAEQNVIACTYTATGKLARKFSINTEWVTQAHTADYVDEERFFYNPSGTPNRHQILRNNKVTQETYYKHNGFDEYVSESPDHVQWEDEQRYNRAGHIYLSKTEKGNAIIFSDLAGHTTLTLNSPKLILKDYSYSQLLSLLDIPDRDLVQRTENILDLSGQVVGMKAPFWYGANNGFPTAACERDRWNNKVVEYDSYGRATHREFDFRNLEIKIVKPEEDALDGDKPLSKVRATTLYGYTKRGTLTAETDALDNVEYYQLDEAEHLLKHILPEGTVKETYHHNVFGEIAYRIDSRKQAYGYSRNRLGNVIEVLFPSGKKRSIGYSKAGFVSRIGNKFGHDYRCGYQNGDLITRVAPLGDITTMEHDRNHEILLLRKPTGGTQLWKRNYSGLEKEYTDLSGVTTCKTHDLMRNIIQESTNKVGHGNRFRVDYGAWRSLLHPGWDKFPVPNTTVKLEGETLKDTENTYQFGQLIKTNDRAAGRLYLYETDSEGRRFHMTMTDTKHNLTIYDVKSHFDSLGRIKRNEVKVLTATGLMTSFNQDKIFDSTDNLRIQKNTLIPAGYGENCSGPQEVAVFKNTYEPAGRLKTSVVTTSYLNNMTRLDYKPGEYPRQGEYFSWGSNAVYNTLFYDADTELGFTQASNGTASRRSIALLDGGILQTTYIESSPSSIYNPGPVNSYRVSRVNSNGVEIYNHYIENSIARHVTRMTIPFGWDMPSVVLTQCFGEGGAYQSTTTETIQYVGFNQYMPSSSQGTIVDKDNNVSKMGQAYMFYNTQGLVNGKLGTADESSGLLGDKQVPAYFEMTNENVPISKLNIDCYDPPFAYKSSVVGRYLFSDINGNYLDSYLEYVLSQPNWTGAHQQFHTAQPSPGGYEVKPWTFYYPNPSFAKVIAPIYSQKEEAINDRYSLSPMINPPIGEQVYYVQKGDTFASIAKQLYGDTAFAEEIIKNNGFILESLLKPGLPIYIPQYIANTNKADNVTSCIQFLNLLQGSILPYIPMPVPPQPKMHSSLFKELVSILIVGLALVAAIELGPELISCANAMGLISASTAQTATTSLAAGQSLTGAAKIANGVAVAISNAAEQGVAIGLRLNPQNHFSFAEVVTSGVGAGLSAGPMEAFRHANNATEVAQAMLKMSQAAVEAQLVGMGLGRNKFDAAAIVAQLASMAISAKVNSMLPGSDNYAEFGRTMLNNTANTIVGSTLYQTPFDAQRIALQTMNDSLDSELQERIDGAKSQGRSAKGQDDYAKDKDKLRRQTHVENNQTAGVAARSSKSIGGPNLFTKKPTQDALPDATKSRAERWQARQNGTGSWKDKYVNKAGQVLDDNVYAKLNLDLSNPNPIYFHDRPIEPVAPELLVGFAYEMIAARIVSAIGATAVARAGINIAKNPEVVMKAPRVVVDVAKEEYASVARLFGRGVGESVEALANRAMNRVRLAQEDFSTTSPNAAEALNRKYSALESAQNNASRSEVLRDGRIRYYSAEKPSLTSGPTRGASYVTEYNPQTGEVSSWIENYNHSGVINRIHPKMLNGQTLNAPHYPPTMKDLLQDSQELNPQRRLK